MSTTIYLHAAPQTRGVLPASQLGTWSAGNSATWAAGPKSLAMDLVAGAAATRIPSSFGQSTNLGNVAAQFSSPPLAAGIAFNAVTGYGIGIGVAGAFAGVTLEAEVSLYVIKNGVIVATLFSTQASSINCSYTGNAPLALYTTGFTAAASYTTLGGEQLVAEAGACEGASYVGVDIIVDGATAVNANGQATATPASCIIVPPAVTFANDPVASISSLDQATLNILLSTTNGDAVTPTYQWYQGSSAAFIPGGAGSTTLVGKTASTAALTGFVAGTTYWFRCVVTASNGVQWVSNLVTVTMPGAITYPVPPQVSMSPVICMPRR